MTTNTLTNLEKIVEDIKFFFRESPSFMSGYSRWYYWTRLPRALIKFLWLQSKNRL